MLEVHYPGDLTFSGINVVTGVERFNNLQAFVYGEYNLPMRSQSRGCDQKRLYISSVNGVNELDFRYRISFISLELG